MTAPRTLTIVLTSATHALTPGFLVRAGKEIADGLEDAVAENREECVRCLGAYLHLAASVQLGPEEAEAAMAEANFCKVGVIGAIQTLLATAADEVLLVIVLLLLGNKHNVDMAS